MVLLCYGQEKDNATRALAVMNMWLHSFIDAEIAQGNTISSPQFFDEAESGLKRFDFSVANPPFSLKKWATGIIPEEDDYKRFAGFTTPPAKNGDYAFLLHVIKSLKSNGKACIVLPLGVLFRGNAEADIRKQIVKKGYIKGIISLPANLFFGTGIAAALIIIDKEGAAERDSIFMIDASKGFVKDGNKNRLREQDIHKIVSTFKNELENNPKYARKVSISKEIATKKNDYNLNIPRYIDNAEADDIQDIEAHLKGGIPQRDIDSLSNYWEVYPTLRNHLFTDIAGRENFCTSNLLSERISSEIYHYPEFVEYSKQMQEVYREWREKTVAYCKELDKDMRPKAEIKRISESVLHQYTNRKLIDKYNIYQIVMNYWMQMMQDDFYEIAADGWSAGNEYSYLSKIKKEKTTGEETRVPVKGLYNIVGRIIPATLLIAKYFVAEQAEIDVLNEKLELIASKKSELIEENSDQGQVLCDVSSKASAEMALVNAVVNAMDIFCKVEADKYSKLNAQIESSYNLLSDCGSNHYFNALKTKAGSVSPKAVNDRLKIVTDVEEKTVLTLYSDTLKYIAQLKKSQKTIYESGFKLIEAKIAKGIEDETLEDVKIVKQYIALTEEEDTNKKLLNKAIEKLEKLVIAKYPALTIDHIKALVIEDKWMADIAAKIGAEMDSISHMLTSRITTLIDRYAEPMPEIMKEVSDYENKVIAHLQKMGFQW